MGNIADRVYTQGLACFRDNLQKQAVNVKYELSKETNTTPLSDQYFQNAI